MSPAPFTIVKVGGSLLDFEHLPARLAELIDSLSGPVALLAGGGPAVEIVRTLDRLHGLGDAAAHWLAIAGLDYTASLLAAIVPGAVVAGGLVDLGDLLKSHRAVVIRPLRLLQDHDLPEPNALPARWEVTSDSIAARITIIARAERLILAKSVSIAPGSTRLDAARLGLVDACFPQVAATLERVELANLRAPRLERVELVRDQEPHLAPAAIRGSM